MRNALKPVAIAFIFIIIVLPILEFLSGVVFLREQHLPLRDVSLLTFYQYWYWYHRQPVFASKLYIALGHAAIILSAAILVAVVVVSRGRSSAIYGAARFAHLREIAQAGLFARSGIILGRYGRRNLCFGGQQFVLVAAPTRSGKGVGIVVPNLLHFTDSVVVLDIKQENYQITAGFRAEQGQSVYLFNPFARDGRTHRYNPLTYVSDEPNLRVRDLLAIGSIIFPSEGKDGSGKDAFWYEAARNLFLGLSLLVFETPELPRTIGEVLRQASGYGQKLATHLNSVITARSMEGRPLSSVCVDALYRVLDNADTTFASILSTFNTALTNWANPIFDAATSESDFLLTDLRRKRISIYVGITPDDLPDAAGILNVFFSQLLNLNMRELPSSDPTLRHQCLLLLDEFTAIGKIASVAKSISFMAGYNLRLLPIIQSTAQLAAVYGENDARNFLTNHAVRIIFAPNEQRDANDYSEMLGYVSQSKSSINRPIGFQKNSGRSETIADERRALMLPQELKEMGSNKEIVLVENCKPILASKIRYYEDPEWTKLLRPAPKIELLDFPAHAEFIDKIREYMKKYSQPAA
ncbi:type IV secretory system conjugative DNA transfer family protein [Burkholderia territorii]|uniref:type IV secretory system conjugative DNA transfer family protein n=1 Tax=Burkholderia territorii TaxID=1503055 RepID=UPI0009BDC195|nr:type IV secretory system conjugative DNA transfer family protein [Burkholderia territorii]